MDVHWSHKPALGGSIPSPATILRPSMDTPRPPKRVKLPATTKIVPNYFDEHKDLVTQLQSLAQDLAKQLRSNLTDPKIGTYSLDSILKIGDALKRWEGSDPLSPKPAKTQEEQIDTQALMQQVLNRVD